MMMSFQMERSKRKRIHSFCIDRLRSIRLVMRMRKRKDSCRAKKFKNWSPFGSIILTRVHSLIRRSFIYGAWWKYLLERVWQQNDGHSFIRIKLHIYIYLCTYIRTSLDTYRLKRVLLRLKTERKSVTIDL